MQLVVVMAVRKAVRAATTTFTAMSMIRFHFILHLPFYIFHRLVLPQVVTAGLDEHLACLERQPYVYLP